MESKLIEEIRSRVQKELDRDRQFIKEVFGTALKVIGILITIITIILGFVGYKTVKGIREAAENKAESVIKEHINESNQKLYEMEIERIRDDALVSSLIAQAAVAEITEYGSKYWRLRKEDTHKLVRILLSKQSYTKTFLYASELLAKMIRSNIVHLAGTNLHILLKNAVSKTYWEKDNELRLASLIELLSWMKYSAAKEDIRIIAFNKDEHHLVRKSAIRYLGRIQDDASLSNLQKVLASESEDPEFSMVAITAIAQIQPKAPEVIQWVENGLGEINPKRMAKSLSLAISLYHFGQKKAATDIFRKFVKDGYYMNGAGVFLPGWTDFRRLEIDHDKRNKTNLKKAYIDYYVFFGKPGKDIIELLISEASVAGDLSKLADVIKSFAGLKGRYSIQVAIIKAWLDPGTEIVTESGKTLSTSDVHLGVSFRVVKGEDKVWVLWYDEFGRSQNEVVKKINNPKGLFFNYQLRRGPVVQDWFTLLRD